MKTPSNRKLKELWRGFVRDSIACVGDDSEEDDKQYEEDIKYYNKVGTIKLIKHLLSLILKKSEIVTKKEALENDKDDFRDYTSFCIGKTYYIPYDLVDECVQCYDEF